MMTVSEALARKTRFSTAIYTGGAMRMLRGPVCIHAWLEHNLGLTLVVDVELSRY
jgi:hypothetical protein